VIPIAKPEEALKEERGQLVFLNPADVAARKLAALKMIENDPAGAEINLRINDVIMQVKNQELTVKNLRQQMETAKADMESVEADLAQEINMATDPGTTKAKYSNAEARSAALTKAKGSNTIYLAALRRFQDAQNAHDTARIELSTLERQLSAMSGARDHAASRLRAIASL
jgi:hypothetical protein